MTTPRSSGRWHAPGSPRESCWICNINRGRKETCRYTNTARIIARTEAGLSWPRALASAIDGFHEYEDRMAVALGELGAAYPEVSALLAHVQGGTVRWLTMMRDIGLRYGKLDERCCGSSPHRVRMSVSTGDGRPSLAEIWKLGHDVLEEYRAIRDDAKVTCPRLVGIIHRVRGQLT